jgi:hypothetical protein
MAVRARELGTRPSPPGDKRLVNVHLVTSLGFLILAFSIYSSSRIAQTRRFLQYIQSTTSYKGGPISDSAPARRARARRGKGGALVHFNLKYNRARESGARYFYFIVSIE